MSLKELTIGFTVGAGLAGAAGIYGGIYGMNRVIDQDNKTVDKQNAIIEQAINEIQKGNNTIKTLSGELNEAHLMMKPIDCSIAQERTTMSFDLVEGQTIRISGGKVTPTREGLVFTNSLGEEQLFPTGFLIGAPSEGQEQYNVRSSALVMRTPSPDPNRYRVTIIGTCLEPPQVPTPPTNP